MKRWIILTVLAVAITATVTVAYPLLSVDNSSLGPEFPAPPTPEGPAPKLGINEETTYNFGVLGQETKGKHQWIFTNEGQGVLEVRGSSTTCSCTTSDLFEGEGTKKTGKAIKIAPGESKPITVNWDTKKWENKYRHSVTIGTNDPDRPTLDLVVEGTIKLALVTIPPESTVSFMNVSNDEPVVRRIVLASPDRPETKITGYVISNPALLGAESREVPPEDLTRYKFEKAHYIEITLKPSPNLGEFSEEIVVETDHPVRKTLALKVRGKITGPITLIPDKVDIRDASTKDGGSQSLIIWERGRSSVNFTVEKKPVGMNVTVEPMPVTPGMKGSKYKMTVTLAPGLEAGLIEGEVVLKTDDPKASEVRVPVSVLVKGAI